MLGPRRIVITGYDAYTPLGLNKDELMDNLINGKTVVRDVSGINPFLESCNVQIGSLFDESQLTPEKLGMTKGDFRSTSYATRVAYAAAKRAIDQSGFLSRNNDDTAVRDRTGVSIGAGFGGISDIEKAVENAIMNVEGLAAIKNRFMAFTTLPGATSSYISECFGFHAGDGASIETACGSGLSSINYGCFHIASGLADIWIGGGTGDPSYLTYGGFDKLRALSRSKEEPGKVSRPFDKERSGFVIGEGAGIIVLEELEHAKKRRANIYGEILGFGATLDGTNPTRPREDAKYTTIAIKNALKMAKLNPEEIDYVNAHATSTEYDYCEVLAIKQALGEHAYKVPISASKSSLGHALNAAGTLGAIIALESIRRGVITPTINLDNPDVEKGCDLDFVPKEAREVRVKKALINALGFGGKNVTLIIGEYQP